MLLLLLSSFVLDENPDTCNICPPHKSGRMFPRIWERLRYAFSTETIGTVINQYQASATLLCNHRVTKRPICAIPCDGVPEMCEDDIDEKCEGPSLELVLSLTILSAIIFIATMLALDGFLAIGQEKSVSPIEVDFPETWKLLRKVVCHNYMWEFEEAMKLAIEHYNGNIMLQPHHKTKDEYFMMLMETNEQAAFFIDCANKSINIKVVLLMKRYFPWISKLMKIEVCRNTLLVCEHMIYLVIRYFDLAKDLLLIYLIWLKTGNYESGSFPIVTFWIMTSSVLLNELVTFTTILLKQNIFENIISIKLFVLIIIMPLIPAVHIYVCLKQRFEEFQLVALLRKEQVESNQHLRIHENGAKLERCMKTIRKLNLAGGNIQCIESMLENFPQLTMVLLITFLSQTSTRMVANVDRLFVNENRHLGYVLTIITILSLVRGQLTYLKAQQRGCQMGLFTLIPYFFIGVVSRKS